MLGLVSYFCMPSFMDAVAIGGAPMPGSVPMMWQQTSCRNAGLAPELTLPKLISLKFWNEPFAELEGISHGLA